jgi:filamentous hemagglutinin
MDSVNKLDAPIEFRETLLVSISTAIGALIGDNAGAASALTATENNCLAHQCLSQKWDKNASGYHHYEVETPLLCNVAEAGCMEAVQHELLANSAPGQDKPASVGKTVNQKLDYGQNITQFAPTANMVVNGTNDNHIFNDGYVVRTVNVDALGNVTIITKGEGVNEPLLKIVPAAIMAKINTDKGISMFKEIGIENLKNIKEKLKN